MLCGRLWAAGVIDVLDMCGMCGMCGMCDLTDLDADGLSRGFTLTNCPAVPSRRTRCRTGPRVRVGVAHLQRPVRRNLQARGVVGADSATSLGFAKFMQASVQRSAGWRSRSMRPLRSAGHPRRRFRRPRVLADGAAAHREAGRRGGFVAAFSALRAIDDGCHQKAAGRAILTLWWRGLVRHRTNTAAFNRKRVLPAPALFFCPGHRRPLFFAATLN